MSRRYWLTAEPRGSTSTAENEMAVPSQVMNTLSRWADFSLISLVLAKELQPLLNPSCRYLDHPTVQYVTAAAADATAATAEVLQSTGKLSPSAKLVESPLDCDMHLFNLR